MLERGLHGEPEGGERGHRDGGRRDQPLRASPPFGVPALPGCAARGRGAELRCGWRRGGRGDRRRGGGSGRGPLRDAQASPDRAHRRPGDRVGDRRGDHHHVGRERDDDLVAPEQRDDELGVLAGSPPEEQGVHPLERDLAPPGDQPVALDLEPGLGVPRLGQADQA